MSNKYSRRGFFGPLLGGISSVVAIALPGLSKANPSLPSLPGDNSPIKKVKALGQQWWTRDPFLFCAHHEDHYPTGNAQMGPQASMEGRDIGSDFLLKDGFRMYHGDVVPGFPRHPHRGFETITVVRTGRIDHTDSLGGAGRYGGGDVQWMTAGAGIQHAEMFPCINQDKSNPLELFQIWLNLPARNKMKDPYFKMLWSEDIPKQKTKDSHGKQTELTVFAGLLCDLIPPSPTPDSWAAVSGNRVGMWNIQMEAGATWTLPKDEADVNRTLYFYEGSGLKIDGHTIQDYHGAVVQADVDLVLEASDTACEILVLQGKPINEPVVKHGPFVMNTRAEVQQAYDDFQRTQFGGWPMKTVGPVHDRNKGRFALHSNGKLETKG